YRQSTVISPLPDPKVEGLSMYTDIMCAPFVAPYCIPLHLSEPFNVDVEYGRISTTLQELELLNAKHQLIEKKSKASSLLGIDQDSPTSTPIKSSKASMLLGLDEGGSSPSSSPKDKKQLLSPAPANSPKFGLLARSASNNLLRDKETSGGGGAGSGGSGSFLGASSQSPLAQSIAINSSTGTLGMSPREDTPGFNLSGISPLHYQHIFTVSTKTQNYSFNARDRDESSQFVDAIKLISLGKAFHPESQTTLDYLTEALELTLKCRAPPVPSLPASPPPPPPHLK
ncbi:hypothetical protein SAMD00019534_069510, partial [Acytostelium subglobosum LB1]|uniref:hypothetical protein n=1 Tax=Acytostelium subglobosum LB1 TaxID=1410327 RepID=UPI000644CDE2